MRLQSSFSSKNSRSLVPTKKAKTISTFNQAYVERFINAVEEYNALRNFCLKEKPGLLKRINNIIFDIPTFEEKPLEKQLIYTASMWLNKVKNVPYEDVYTTYSFAHKLPSFYQYEMGRKPFTSRQMILDILSGMNAEDSSNLKQR